MKYKIKEKIESNLQNGNLQKSIDILNAYEHKYPKDRDLKYYKCIYMLQIGDIEKAIEISEECVRKFPTSYEAYYYNGCSYQAAGMVIEALKAYKITEYLYNYLKIEDLDIYEDVCNQITILEEKYIDLVNEYIDTNDVSNILKADSFLKRMNSFWGKNEKSTRDSSKLIVGTEYWVTDSDLRFVGVYRSPVPDFIGKENMSLIRTQAEFLKYTNKGIETSVIGTDNEYLIPIASTENNNVYTFKNEENKNIIVQRVANHFNYYRVKNGTHIISKYKAYYGYPIPLKHDAKRKNLS